KVAKRCAHGHVTGHPIVNRAAVDELSAGMPQPSIREANRNGYDGGVARANAEQVSQFAIRDLRGVHHQPVGEPLRIQRKVIRIVDAQLHVNRAAGHTEPAHTEIAKVHYGLREYGPAQGLTPRSSTEGSHHQHCSPAHHSFYPGQLCRNRPSRGPKIRHHLHTWPSGPPTTRFALQSRAHNRMVPGGRSWCPPAPAEDTPAGCMPPEP